MIGIYKITSPKNRIYIGQSVDIEKRFLSYKRLDCKGQTRLYASFKKYGLENHKFEIIVECDKNELNEFERYYQELYCVISTKGLNCQYVKTKLKKYVHSEETKKKISESNKGKQCRKYVMSEEHKLKISISKKGKKRPDVSEYLRNNNHKKIGKLNPFFGKKHTEETKLKISITKKLNSKKNIPDPNEEITLI